jgi:hypothetical protein
MLQKIKQYIAYAKKNFKQELVCTAGWLGFLIIWWGSNWKVAIGSLLVIAAQT